MFSFPYGNAKDFVFFGNAGLHQFRIPKHARVVYGMLCGAGGGGGGGRTSTSTSSGGAGGGGGCRGMFILPANVIDIDSLYIAVGSGGSGGGINGSGTAGLSTSIRTAQNFIANYPDLIAGVSGGGGGAAGVVGGSSTGGSSAPANTLMRRNMIMIQHIEGQSGSNGASGAAGTTRNLSLFTTQSFGGTAGGGMQTTVTDFPGGAFTVNDVIHLLPENIPGGTAGGGAGLDGLWFDMILLATGGTGGGGNVSGQGGAGGKGVMGSGGGGGGSGQTGGIGGRGGDGWAWIWWE